MIPVVLDISDVLDEFSFSREEAKSLSKYIISNVAREYMMQWEKRVNNTLKQTQDQYLQAMSVEYPDDNSAVFVLDGKGDSKIALMLEEGSAPFDMKEGFEQSDKKTTKEDGGWFLTIPFRVATSEAIAESNVFGGQMPKPIENIARNQSGEPITASQIPSKFKVKGTGGNLEVKGKKFPVYNHKAFKYEGIVHSNKNNHGQYMKFRRVSDKSEEESWLHPGFEAYKLMDKTLQNMDLSYLIGKSTDEFINATVR